MSNRLTSPTYDERLIEAQLPEEHRNLPGIKDVTETLRVARSRLGKAEREVFPAVDGDGSLTPAARSAMKDSYLSRAWEKIQKQGASAFDALERAQNGVNMEARESWRPPIATNQQEVRAALARLPAKERRKVLNRAVETGDRTVVGSVLSGSPFLSGMEDPEIDHLRRRWVDTHAPDVAAKERSVAKAREILERARKALESTVGETRRNLSGAAASIRARENALQGEGEDD